MKLTSGVLGVEPPVDGGLGGVAFLDQNLDSPPEHSLTRTWTPRRSVSSSGSRCFKQERDSTLNSISAMFNQLPCLGV